MVKSEQTQQKPVRWQPAEGEIYYYITSWGEVKPTSWGDTTGKFHYAQNNCFKTEEEAEEQLKNLETKGELRLLSKELNKKIIDWKDCNQVKFYLAVLKERLFCPNTCFSRYGGMVYCLDGNFYNIAIERIGKERLIKMIKSGV